MGADIAVFAVLSLKLVDASWLYLRMWSTSRRFSRDDSEVWSNVKQAWTRIGRAQDFAEGVLPQK